MILGKKIVAWLNCLGFWVLKYVMGSSAYYEEHTRFIYPRDGRQLGICLGVCSELVFTS